MYKILIMLHAMPMGGTEVALKSMLELFDYEMCEVELLLVRRYGELLAEVPHEIKISSFSEREALIFEDVKKCFSGDSLLKYPGYCSRRIFMVFQRYFYKGIKKEFDIWEKQAPLISERKCKYDIAIDYDGFCSRYIATKVKASKKISWNHFDYRYLRRDSVLDHKYFLQMDYLIAVSKKSAAVLEKSFPDMKGKIATVFNFINRKKIMEAAVEEIHETILTESNVLKICSVGRLEDQKGYDLSIEAAARLRDREIPFIWYVLGEGSKRKYLESLLEKKSLEQKFLLLSSKKNPYPYIANADIYVQTSRFEGYGIALAEARILGKPSVVTNVTGLNEQVKHEWDGIIAEDAEKISDAIEYLSKKNVREYYRKNLEKNMGEHRENKDCLRHIFGFECFRKEG